MCRRVQAEILTFLSLCVLLHFLLTQLTWGCTVASPKQQREGEKDQQQADLLGVRNRQVLVNDFSLPLPPPTTHLQVTVALGNSWLLIHPSTPTLFTILPLHLYGSLKSS